jgi:hypothetical protein
VNRTRRWSYKGQTRVVYGLRKGGIFRQEAVWSGKKYIGGGCESDLTDAGFYPHKQEEKKALTPGMNGIRPRLYGQC